MTKIGSRLDRSLLIEAVDANAIIIIPLNVEHDLTVVR